MFSSFGFQWPVQLTKLFAASSMSTFNEQLMAPECSIGSWSFELKCVPALCTAGAAAACGEGVGLRASFRMHPMSCGFVGGT